MKDRDARFTSYAGKQNRHSSKASYATGRAIARHAAESGTASAPCTPCVARDAQPHGCKGGEPPARGALLWNQHCLVVEGGKVVEAEARANRLAPEASGHLFAACTTQELKSCCCTRPRARQGSRWHRALRLELARAH